METAVGSGARVLSVTALPPSSTEKHVFEVARVAGTVARLVLRRYHDRARLGNDPGYVPANEVHALRCLEPTPVPAPRLVATDLHGQICGAPALLETWVPGRQAWRPDDVDACLASAAEVLVAIHRVDCGAQSTLPRYVPYYDRTALARAATGRPAYWARAIDVVSGPPPRSPACFIHRDYHPGNALTDGARVTAVVDWATAAWGPPGIDLARMRLLGSARRGRLDSRPRPV